ncbi:hypothetical protein PGB90_009573 [Kerria lacca]
MMRRCSATTKVSYLSKYLKQKFLIFLFIFSTLSVFKDLKNYFKVYVRIFVSLVLQ